MLFAGDIIAMDSAPPLLPVSSDGYDSLAPATPKPALLSPITTLLTDTTPLSDDFALYDLDQASHLSLSDARQPSPTRKRVKKKEGSPTLKKKLSRRKLQALQPGLGYSLVPAAGKIFRNLLILEELLRGQVVEQRALRRKYLTFLAVLCLLIAGISHHLYFNDPEMSSKGTMRVILQFILIALMVTLLLYHLLGEYQKTIVLPRKFLSSTNKGLRQLNVRLMKIKTSWLDEVPDLLREVLLVFITYCLNTLHFVSPKSKNNRHLKLEVFLVTCQLQCQPRIGVTDVKLVLNARVFNTDIREGWEVYRNEFWIKEGIRRRLRLLEFTKEKLEQSRRDRMLPVPVAPTET